MGAFLAPGDAGGTRATSKKNLVRNIGRIKGEKRTKYQDLVVLRSSCWSITRFKPDVKVVYGELQGCRCSIGLAHRGLVAIIAMHIAAPVELLKGGRGAKFGLATQFRTPGGDALRDGIWVARLLLMDLASGQK